MAYPPLADTMRDADVVFEGMFAGFRLFPIPAYRFSATRVWKGPLRDAYYFPLVLWPPGDCTTVNDENAVVWGQSSVYGLIGSNDPYSPGEVEAMLGAGTPVPASGAPVSRVLGWPVVALAVVSVWLLGLLPGRARRGVLRSWAVGALCGSLTGLVLAVAWGRTEGALGWWGVGDYSPLASSPVFIALTTGVVFGLAMWPGRLPPRKWVWCLSCASLCLALAVWTFEPLVLVAEYALATGIGAAAGLIAHWFSDPLGELA